MMRTVTTFKVALLGGAVALMAGLPLTAVQADEPLRLDTAQLDSVTAAAAAGFELIGGGAAFGTLFSQSTTTLTGQGQSTPAFSSANGSISNFSLAIGGTGANTPTATADTALIDVTGDRQIVRQINRQGSGRGYAWAYSGTFVASYASEFPL